MSRLGALMFGQLSSTDQLEDEVGCVPWGTGRVRRVPDPEVVRVIAVSAFGVWRFA